MNPLLYSSNEMFSSTELIRKSKKIFDKLLSSEIEKAIILRDGKPGFMLLDFDKYEELMKEYLELKQNGAKVVVEEEPMPIVEKQSIKTQKETIIKEKPIKKVEDDDIGFSMNLDNSKTEKIEDDMSEEELRVALEKIERLGFEEEKEKTPETKKDDDLAELSYQRKEQPLKEFWD